MKTLALVNQKGGCGKTTTAVNLAGALALARSNGGGSVGAGSRVLLIDLDPQAHATLALGIALVPGEISLADVLMRGAPLASAVREAPAGIALVPASGELGELEEVAQRIVHPERLLKNALQQVSDAYDFVLLDCPPRADGVLTANALRAADVVLLVVETGAFALQGALGALSTFEDVAEGLEADFELRVVATLFDRRMRLARELLVGTQARFGSRMFDTVIHQSVRLREAASCGVPVQILDPDCRAARDFEALAREVRALAQPPAPARRVPDALATVRPPELATAPLPR
jgi:chromosome partitioning protein